MRYLPHALVSDLRSRGHEISISTLTIFELAAKGAKLARESKLEQGRVLEGLRAILSDESVHQVDFQQTRILQRAIVARSKIDDFVDCLILCSALTAADALVSEDETIRTALSDESFRRSLQPSNPAFTVYTSRGIP